MTTPADLICAQLLASPRVTDISRSIWTGGVLAANDAPAIVVNVAEIPAYITTDTGLLDTRATITVVAVASTYQAAYELAVVVRGALHGQTLQNAEYVTAQISFSSLENAVAENVGQAIIYQIPQVFACNIRRL